MGHELEEGSELQLDFSKLESVAMRAPGVLPAVAQDAETGRVLIVGYANELALKTALEEKVAVFWSTSRNELWIKGASSGDLLELIETRVNCEQNSILYLVKPKGEGACHTKEADGKARASCYYRVIRDGQLEQSPYEPIWGQGQAG
ncbi:MAG: phosphoribosyl-AMP cyclohydrolase [Puniceicoccaceae bacterium]